MQLVGVESHWLQRVQRMARYAVPEQCIFCKSAGRVAMTAKTRGGDVVICWYCRDCDRDWPAKHQEQLEERRTGPADRRRLTRADRRSRNG